MNLYFLQYNNYYNRIVKKYDDLRDYTSNHNYVTRANVNFNPGDGLQTELTTNWTTSWMPDYLVTNSGDTEQLTRWFIISHVRLRGEQYKMLLRRDVVADNLEAILNADCFIEKAIIDNDNPLIFNTENMSVNQIKTKEWQLRDSTKCPWICCYYSKEDVDTNYRMKVEYQNDITYDYEVSNQSFNEWKNSQRGYYFKDLKIATPIDKRYLYSGDRETRVYTSQFNYQMTTLMSNQAIFTLESSWPTETNKAALNFVSEKFGKQLTGVADNNLKLSSFPSVSVFNEIYKSEGKGIINALGRVDTYSTDLSLLQFNNKIIKFSASNGDIEYIKVKVRLIDDDIYTTGTVTSASGYLWNAFYNNHMKELVYGSGSYTLGNQTRPIETVFYYQVHKQTLEITGEIVPDSGVYSATISKERQLTEDSVFGLFCIPYPVNGESVIAKVGNSLVDINPDISLRTAVEFSEAYAGGSTGGGLFKDMQILPYCPIPNIVNDDGIIELTDTRIYDVITYRETSATVPGNIVGIILHPSKTSFTLNIPFNEYSLEDVKMSNETELMRLVSPNYSGQFEFNPARNNSISFFNVDCTYQPYNPYIHVNPDFGGLYGADFNDARGLICSGDFSLPMILDQWSAYQMNNKNYNSIFNREIENMELHQNVERTRQKIDIAMNIGEAAMHGAKTGGPLGALGYAAGSAAMGAIDYNLSETLRNEALDYKKDMFGYQLGNIQAMPQGISKVSPFTYNNKYFPILEYYTCTEQEKIAIANKIAYNGMTVMAIGKLKDYINNVWNYKNITSKGYIKGAIIRLEGLQDDYHVLNAISDEIYKGVYYAK